MKRERISVRSSIDSFVWFSTTEANLQEAKIIRYLPLRLFFGDPVPKEKDGIVDAIVETIREFDFEYYYQEQAESGSWRQTIWMRTIGFFSRKDVQDRLAKIEDAFTTKF